MSEMFKGFNEILRQAISKGCERRFLRRMTGQVLPYLLANFFNEFLNHKDWLVYFEFKVILPFNL